MADTIFTAFFEHAGHLQGHQMKVVSATVILLLLIQQPLIGQQASQSNDPVVMVRGDDSEMLAAEEKARNSLDQFIEALRERSLTPKKLFYVKCAFTDGQQNEHIWLTDVKLIDGRFTGQINNTPQLVTNIKFGQIVGDIGREDVNDWIIMDNGKMIGGFTAKLLMERKASNQPNTQKTAQHKPDFSTPENAIHSLQQAFKSKDIDAAIRCKDFGIEAQITITNIDPLFASDEDLIQKTAKMLEQKFRAEITKNGFPDTTRNSQSFPERKPLAGHTNIVVVTEEFVGSDGHMVQEKHLVAKTADGWRVLNRLDEHQLNH